MRTALRFAASLGGAAIATSTGALTSGVFELTPAASPTRPRATAKMIRITVLLNLRLTIIQTTPFWSAATCRRFGLLPRLTDRTTSTGHPSRSPTLKEGLLLETSDQSGDRSPHSKW